MKRIALVVATLVTALAFVGGAQAGKIQTAADGDGGGAPAIGFFWIYSYTYVDGQYRGIYCQWASDGNMVWQTGVCV